MKSIIGVFFLALSVAGAARADNAQTTLLNLSIITSGLTLAPFTSATCAAMPLNVIGQEVSQ